MGELDFEFCPFPGPPEWIWTGELEDKRPKGEIGVFRRIIESNIQPSNKCFLFIDYEESNYIGCLTVDDHGFCVQIVIPARALLQSSHR
jgi:hypothetical protein